MIKFIKNLFKRTKVKKEKVYYLRAKKSVSDKYNLQYSYDNSNWEYVRHYNGVEYSFLFTREDQIPYYKEILKDYDSLVNFMKEQKELAESLSIIYLIP